MIQLTEITYDSAKPIDGYGPGFFRVGGQVIEGAALITVRAAKGWQGYEDTGPLLALADEIDVLILGTGRVIAHPPAGLRAALDAVGIGLEPMDSPAACRTYNVLLSEGRRVAAALLPVE